MKKLLSKEIKKGTSKVVAVFLAALMSVSSVGMGTIQAKAEEPSESANNYGLHNPRVAYNYRDTVIFGHYWQEDTNGDGVADQNDEKQPIVWQILETYEDDTALVISDKILDGYKYFNGLHDGENTIYSCTWKNSGMRQWLNDSDNGFLKEAFSENEQSLIKEEHIDFYPVGYNGIDNEHYCSDDKVFLLSYYDMVNSQYGFNEYKNHCDQARTANVTSYAKNKGFTNGTYGQNYFWLRSFEESNSDCTLIVTDTGSIIAGPTNNTVGGVRPALRIKLSSSYVTKGERVKVSVKGGEWDTISFGKYDGNELKWRVLNVSGDDALLLSDKVITSKAYNDNHSITSVTWENCTLRNWLNNEFINETFSETEKAMIKTTSIPNPDNSFYGTEYGNATSDQIFLLSLDDIIRASYGFPSNYFIYTDNRIAENLDGENVWWWLLSPSLDNLASHVDINGYVLYYAKAVNEVGGVRPALHINLASSSWTKGDNVSIGDTSGAIEQEPYTGDSNGESGENGGNSNGSGNNNGNVSSNNESGISGSENNSSVNDSKPVNNSNTGSNITKKSQNISGVKNITKSYSTKKFSIKAKTSGDGKLTYSSSNKKVAKISANGKVTLVGTGKTKITIKAAETNSYKSTKKTIILTVKTGKQKITSKVKSKTMEYTDKPFYLGTKVLGKAKVTYKSSNPKVLRVDSKGKVTLTGIGKATITIKTKKNNNYAAATKKITIKVTAPKLSLNCNALQGKKVSLSWNTSTVYDGYYVEIAYDSKFKDTVRGGVGYFNKGRSVAVISGFKTAGTKCYARIRPYCKVNGRVVLYSWSNTATFTVIE